MDIARNVQQSVDWILKHQAALSSLPLAAVAGWVANRLWERKKRRLENEKLSLEVLGIKERHEELSKLLDEIYQAVNGVYNELDKTFAPLAQDRQFRTKEADQLEADVQAFVGQLVHRPKFEAAAARLRQLQQSLPNLETPQINDLLQKIVDLSGTLDYKHAFAQEIIPQLRQNRRLEPWLRQLIRQFIDATRNLHKDLMILAYTSRP